MKTHIKQTDSPVSEALILVCEKCGAEAQVLQKTMKEMIKETGKKGVLRAVITSCLDICPDDEIAVCISRRGEDDEFLTVKGDVKELAATLLETASR